MGMLLHSPHPQIPQKSMHLLSPAHFPAERASPQELAVIVTIPYPGFLKFILEVQPILALHGASRENIFPVVLVLHAVAPVLPVSSMETVLLMETAHTVFPVPGPTFSAEAPVSLYAPPDFTQVYLYVHPA